MNKKCIPVGITYRIRDPGRLGGGSSLPKSHSRFKLIHADSDQDQDTFGKFRPHSCRGGNGANVQYNGLFIYILFISNLGLGQNIVYNLLLLLADLRA